MATTKAIKDLVLRTWFAKTTKDEIEAEHKALQNAAIDLFHEAKLDGTEIEYEGKLIKATLVEGTTTVLDVEALKEKLTKKQWDAITVRVIDKELLEAHVLTKDIDVAVVESCCELKPKAGYFKFTVKEAAAPVAAIKKARAGRKASSR